MTNYIQAPSTPLTMLDSAEQPFFMLTALDAVKTHCVYQHEIFDGHNPPVLIYIGVTRLSELFAFADAKRNSEWIRYVPASRPFMTRILALGEFSQCSNYRAKLAMTLKPHCNLRGYDLATTTRIRCIEDGLEFDTITAAAKHYGLSGSALSNHINLKPGHRSVKGRTFERIART